MPLDAPAPAVRHIQERLPGELLSQPRPVEPALVAPAGIGLDELQDPGQVIRILGQQGRLTLVVPTRLESSSNS